MWSLTTWPSASAELPGGDGVLHPLVEVEERVERRDRPQSAPQAARSASRRSVRPLRRRRRSADRRRRRSRRARRSPAGRGSAGRSSGVDEDRVGEALERGEALDRDGPEARRPGVDRPVAEAIALDRRVGGLSRLGADRRSRARRPSRAASRASGTTSVVPGMTPSKTSPVRPSIVMTSPARGSGRRTRPRRRETSMPGRPDDRRDPPAAGDDRGVAGQPAAGRQDAGRRGHPVDVVGRGLGPDEDRRLRRRPPRPGRPPGSWRSGRSPSPARPAGPVTSGRTKLLRALVVVGGSASSERTRSTASARVSGNVASSAMSTAIRSAACGAPLADADLEQPEPARPRS